VDASSRGMTSEEAANEPPISSTDAPDTCLDERKYWCFLLSSIFTFLAGLLIVLVWRLFAFLCCRKEVQYGPNDPKQKEQKAARQGKQEFEGTFMTEAKDWAGELISGQTTTGRILVSDMPSGGDHRPRDTFFSLSLYYVDTGPARLHPPPRPNVKTPFLAHLSMDDHPHSTTNTFLFAHTTFLNRYGPRHVIQKRHSEPIINKLLSIPGDLPVLQIFHHFAPNTTIYY
jgi:hypothetical protein